MALAIHDAHGEIPSPHYDPSALESTHAELGIMLCADPFTGGVNPGQYTSTCVCVGEERGRKWSRPKGGNLEDEKRTLG